MFQALSEIVMATHHCNIFRGPRSRGLNEIPCESENLKQECAGLTEMDRACSECGLDYCRGYAPDERNHRAVHDKTVNGHRTKLPDGVHFVTHRSPMRLQKLVELAASSALWDTKYDFSSFTAIRKQGDEYETVAAFFVSDARVCGLVVSRERDCEYTADLTTFQVGESGTWRPTNVSKVELHKRRAIDMIWVLRRRRRQGIAHRLMLALAGHCAVRAERVCPHGSVSGRRCATLDGLR